MKFNRIVSSFFVASLVLVLVAGSRLNAQTPKDPAFEAIAPLLKRETFLVVHVDVKKLDIDAIADKCSEQFKKFMDEVNKQGSATPELGTLTLSISDAEDETSQVKTTAKGIVDSLLAAGVNEFYILSMKETVQQIPAFFAVPGQPNVNEELGAMLKSVGIHNAGTLDNFTIYAAETSGAGAMMPGMTGMTPPEDDPEARTKLHQGLMKTLKTIKAARRPEINAALHLQRKSPVRIVFAPTAGLKGMAQQFAPMWAGQVPMPDGVDLRAVLASFADLQTISLGIDLAAFRFNFAGQFANEAKAAKADALIRKLAEMSQEEEMDEATKEAFEDFLPKLRKNRLLLVVHGGLLDKHQEKMADISSIVMPAMPMPMPMHMRGGGVTGEDRTGEDDPFAGE